MTVYAQSSRTLATITDVKEVYPYYYLASSSIDSGAAPHNDAVPEIFPDTTHNPGSRSVTVTYNGNSYIWTDVEPSLTINNNIISGTIGQLYVVECTIFSNNSYNWGPLMTSSTYAAAKAAYNNAIIAKNATDLLGGHFIFTGSSSGQSTPSGAGVIQQISDDPAEWGYNTWIGSNGIKLRYDETTLSKWDTSSLIFYTPGTTHESIEVGAGGITIYRGWDATEQENLKGIEITPLGIDIYGSDQDDPDVMVTSDGIYMFKGGILGGASDHFIYLSTEDLGSIYSSLDEHKTDWREIIGTNFGVDSSGNVYATNAHLTGEVNATSGYIGTATDGFIIDSYGFYVGTKTSNTTNSIALSRQLFTRTIDGASRSDLCFAIGSKFAVDKDGNLYANGANITNINASSLNIGPVVKYYVCDTAKATQAKRIDNVPNFTLTTGLTINVTFTYGNTSSAPTLNINDTGVISIMAYDGSALDNSYEYNIAAGSSRTFTYNGTHWLLQDNGAGDAYLRAYNAEDTAYDYITKIDNAGIFISPYNQSPSTSSPGNSVKIDGSGMIVYNGGVAIAQYGTTAIIGRIANGKSRVEIKDFGIDFYNKDSGEDVTLAHIGYGKGTAAGGSTSDSYYPYYTFGLRLNDNSSTRGNYSFAEGLETTASGFASHAEGYSTVASGRGAHAEGEETLASKGRSHAEGYSTVASNHHAHAEGEQTTASGMNSHAQNFYTNAGFDNQTAIGKYNNNISTNAFEIGNGNGPGSNARSNAFAVDWNGKLFTKQIQAGTIAQTTVSANSYVDVSVTFPKTMSGTPVVTVSLISNSTAGGFGNVSAAVLRNSVSSTGFTCRIHNADTSSRMPAVSWIAMNVGTP